MQPVGDSEPLLQDDSKFQVGPEEEEAGCPLKLEADEAPGIVLEISQDKTTGDVSQSGFVPSGEDGYRADVDGLRAVAVVAVVLYHLNGSWLPGGFAGVDLFFVISGFVVAKSLLARGEDNTQGFVLGFLARRVRRLLPSVLLVVCSAAVMLGIVAPPTWDMRVQKYLKIGMAGVVGNANTWLLLRHDSYWDNFDQGEKLLNPFEHLWSLGVEEQFYLVFPFILVCSCSQKASRGELKTWPCFLLTGLLGLSLLFSYRITAQHPLKAFYLMPSRFWELACGALWLLVSQSQGVQQSLGHPLLSFLLQALAIGFLALSFCWLPFLASFPFPGALLPVAAALCYLAAGPSCLLNRLLSTPLPVYLGRLSYAIYLWHLPVLALTRWLTWDMSSVAELVFLSLAPLLTLALAIASYHLVEEPLRRMEGLSNGHVLFYSLCATTFALAWLLLVSFVRAATDSPRCPLALISAGTLLMLFNRPGKSRFWCLGLSLGLLLALAGALLSTHAAAPQPTAAPPSTAPLAINASSASTGNSTCETAPACACRRSSTALSPPGAVDCGWCPRLEMHPCLDAVPVRGSAFDGAPAEYADYCRFNAGLPSYETALDCLTPPGGRQEGEKLFFLMGDSKAFTFKAALVNAVRPRRVVSFTWFFPFENLAENAWKVLLNQLEPGDTLVYISLYCVLIRPGEPIDYNDQAMLQAAAVAATRGARLLLIEPSPQMGDPKMKDPKYLQPQVQKCSKVWDTISNRTNVYTWHTWQLFCDDQQRCNWNIPGTQRLCLFDGGHMNIDCALYLAPFLCSELRRLGL